MVSKYSEEMTSDEIEGVIVEANSNKLPYYMRGPLVD